MKTTKYFLVLAIMILGFSFANANAQTYASNSSVRKIEQQVFKKINGLPFYGLYDHIAFQVEGSTVTLYGKVLSLETRSDAEKAVSKIEGVTSIVNKIENITPSPYDARIRRDIVSEFSDHAGLSGYLRGPHPSVRLIVDNGRIALEGYVSDRATANLMNILVNGVPGVFGVENNLIVEKDLR